MKMDDWRQNTKERLEVLSSTVGQVTPGVLYGALCSSTLLPVIAAANETYGKTNNCLSTASEGRINT